MHFVTSKSGTTKTLAIAILLIIVIAGTGIGYYTITHWTSSTLPTPSPSPPPTFAPSPSLNVTATPSTSSSPTPTSTAIQTPVPTSTPTSTTKPTPTSLPNPSLNPTPSPTEQTTQEKIRDAAMDFIKSKHPETALFMIDLAWTGGRATPQNIVGAETYMYYSQGWNVTLNYPVVPNAVYKINADYSATSVSIPYRIIWQGTWQNDAINETSFIFAQ